jgi:uncharacterized protein
VKIDKLKIIFVLVIIFFSFFLYCSGKKEIKEVIIRNKSFFVEIARTKIELERGLSLHIPLLNDQGMLFIFPKEELHGFWMKDMTFPIDIIWIDSNLKIVHIEKNISPDTYPKIFSPATKNLYVLEIMAGQTDFLKINVGDRVNFVKK